MSPLAKFYLVIGLFGAVAPFGSAALGACPDTSNAQPARLVDSPEQRRLVSELMPPWRSDEQVRMIKFGAYISELGDVRAACCASETHHMTANAYRKLGANIGRLKFVPASDNGNPIRVFSGFTILARKTEEGVKTVLLMNQLTSFETFGLHYTAPQRIWIDTLWSGNSAVLGGMFVEVQVGVSAQGIPSNAEVVQRNGSSTRRDQHFVNELESACFVPGHVEGEPTPMPYVEAFAGS